MLKVDHLPPVPSFRWNVPSIIGLLCALVAIWMFVWRGALDGVFHFDDYGNIVDNERIRSLWPLTPFLRNNRPVGLYSFALNYHFFGTEPYSYHVVNVLIHLTNGMLLFSGCLITYRLWHGRSGVNNSNGGVAVLLASIVSSVWVIHPLTTQAVTNVVQRYESLASMGYFGVWVGVLLILCQRFILGTCLVLGMAWIGLMSKEVFATAPLAVLLFDRLVTEEGWWRIFKKRGWVYALMLTPYLWFVPSVSRFFDPIGTANSSMGIGMQKISAWEYFRTQPEVIFHYLGLVFWPARLCFDYLWRIQNNPLVYFPLGFVLVVCLLTALIAYLRGLSSNKPVEQHLKRGGMAGWLALSFFMVLAPTSSCMPIADLAVEHRMYLASAIVIAGTLLGGWLLFDKLLDQTVRPGILRLGVGLMLTGCMLLLALRTHQRNQDYRDSLRLWQSTAKLSPQNPRAWYNLGREIVSRGDHATALRPMISAVGLSSQVPMFDTGLADCLRHIGRTEDAIKLYQRAIRNKADYGEAYNNLGTIYLARREYDTAEEALKRAVELGQSESQYNLATLYLERGRRGEARRLLETILDKQPEFHPAARRLAWILATAPESDLRDVDRAAKLFNAHYSAEQSTNPYVLDTFAVIQAANGNFEQAIKFGKQALREAEKKGDLKFSEQIALRIDAYGRHKSWYEEGVP